jgi:ADP-L-glycero-D-manno-heptose 6-epimerase
MSRPVVLVTGGAGFIGSNIVADLAADHDVAVCDRLGQADEGKWRNLAKHAVADFVAPEAIWAWLARRGEAVEAIVHMGAISSTTHPDADEVMHNNFGLSRDLWDWAAAHQRRLIYASSAATYGDGEAGFDDADDLASLSRLRPLNVYGWSKALFDVYARREADRGHAPAQWAGLKFFNVYGPNEAHKGAMRSVACQIWPKVAAGEAVRLFKSHREGFEDGGQMRDFVHVADAVAVVRWLLASPGVNGVFNLGSGRARSFADLAHAVFAAAGRPARIEYFDMPEALRDRYQYFTEARLDRLRAAGYAAPFTPLEQGVADYVRGYLSQPDPYR